MPPESKSPFSARSGIGDPKTMPASLKLINLWHSSPLDPSKYEMSVTNEQSSGPMLLETKSVLRESNHNTKPRQLPPPLTKGLVSPHVDSSAASDAKEVKRQAFSGPIMGKPWQNKPSITASGPIGSTGYPLHSGSFLHTAFPRLSTTPQASPRASPTTFISSPKIGELHELPRPPTHLASKTPSTQVGYSGPLPLKGPELSATNKLEVSDAVSTLPMPPPIISRSYSIPSRGQIGMALHALKPLEASQIRQMGGDVVSPPLTPISLSNIQPASPAS